MAHENELATPDVTRPEPVVPEMTFHEPDPVTNTQTVTVKIPGGANPEATRAMFINALWGLRDLDTTKGENK